MKKKFLSILLTAAMCFALLPSTALAAEGITYLDAAGAAQTCANFITVDSSESDVNWDSGWYVVNGKKTINGSVTLDYNADVHLILKDGAELTISNGVLNDGNTSLSICGQSAGTGELIVRRNCDSEDINYGNFNIMAVSYLTVNGGKLTVDGSNSTFDAADCYIDTKAVTCNKLTVNGGSINANGINVNITDGGGDTANTTVSGYSSAINAHKLQVNDGSITAVGGAVSVNHHDLNNYHSSYGIRVWGDNNNSGGINISGGSVTASGGTVSVNGDMALPTYVLYSRSIGICSDLTVNVSGGSVNTVGGNVNLNRLSGGKYKFDTYTESIGLDADDLVFTGGTIKGTHGTTSLKNESNGNIGTKREYGASVDGASISGGSINDLFIYYTDISDISAGSFGSLSVSEDKQQVTDLLAYGHAFYPIDGNSMIRVEEGAVSIKNVTVGEHTCSFTHTDGKYSCECGRSYEMEPVIYINPSGIYKYCGRYELVEDSNDDIDWGDYNEDSWYVVKDNTTVDGEIDLDGDVHVILCDNAVLTVKDGICDEDRHLNIYAQSAGETMGRLTAYGGSCQSEITDAYSYYGIYCEGLTINGGVVEATGAEITLDDYDDYETFGVCCYDELTVNGGRLIATGGTITGEDTSCSGESYGIYLRGDHDYDDTDITINGGIIEATGGDISGKNIEGKSYGIYSYGNDDADVTINGGKITANGGKISGENVYGKSYGIFIYSDDDDAEVEINGGSVTATGGSITADKLENNCLGESYGFCIESYDSDAELTVTGGTLTANGSDVTVSGTGTDPSYPVWGSSCGIYFDGDDDEILSVSSGTVDTSGGNVSVTRTGGSSNSYDNASSIGIYVKDAELSGNGKINASYGTAALSYSPELPEGSDKGFAVSYELQADHLYVNGGEMKLKDSLIYFFIDTPSNAALRSLLADGYAYWQEYDKYEGTSEGFVKLDGKTYLNGAYIKPCTHSASAGVCEYCGKNLGGNTSSGGGSSSVTYTITASNTENGTINISSKRAEKGKIITVTAVPDNDHILETLTVLDKNGNKIELTAGGDGKYTFKMPASNVTITAVFTNKNTAENIFEDVSSNSYYYDAVMWASKKDITGGVDSTHFAPDLSCTRAQAVTFLWRAAGSPEPASASSLTDISADDYYTKAVSWAVENGITNGIGNDKFAPDRVCTRAQIVSFLFRYAALNKIDTVTTQELISGYIDADSVPSYAVSAFNWALAAGIVQGSDGSLMPDNDCTRAQIVTMMYRLLEK